MKHSMKLNHSAKSINTQGDEWGNDKHIARSQEKARGKANRTNRRFTVEAKKSSYAA